MMGMNPRKMQQMMKQMGIRQEEINATEVIIKVDGKELVIPNPQVSKVNMMGQETFQIVGEVHERQISSTPEISEDDIQMVADQTGKDKNVAKKALEESNGDLAEAILKLKEE
tara:strand:+ start:172 stop:510 length:339 start_codon:yes stop_codon:yes gene_type:complete